MKKQKKLFIFSGIVICLITITLVIINFVNSDNVIYESDNANASDNRVIGSNALTMMYETEAGSGEYTVASDNTWPQDGYVFNERLSGCENGSKLTWDDERKAVILSTTVSDRCYVYFDVEVITLADYIINEVYTGTDGENGLYYHDGMSVSGVCKYNGNDVYSSLTYMQNQEMELSNNYTYCEKVFQVSINGTPMLYLDNSAGHLITNVGPVIWDTSDNTCKTQDGNNPVVNAMFQTVTQNACTGDAYLVGTYYVAGLSEVGIGSFENIETIEFPEEAEDNSYRYSGANPNNYVCFGSTESPCPHDNLYRIIGAFDDDKDSNYQIKLIKRDYTTSAMLGTDGRDYYRTYSYDTSYYKGSMDTSTIAAYRWNYDTSVSTYGSNDWTTSEFNKINLNTNYWNYLGTTWQNLIAETAWHLGGMTSDNTAKAFYDGERNNAGYGSNPTTYTDEIGLMYRSDYGYAAYPDAWTTNLNNYNNSTIKSNNWMYMGLYEWTITPYSSYSYSVLSVHYYGGGNLSIDVARDGYAARPVFYLKSNVALQGGSGTSSDPYRLAV